MSTYFGSAADSHQHSLEILNSIRVYDEFLESIKTFVDLGCGTGEDLRWWATLETNEESPKPLNIQCTGVDILDSLPMAHDYHNVIYQKTNFEDIIHTPAAGKFDVLWCHDAFQYVINPIQTLSNWWEITSDGGMLVLSVPQSTNVQHKQLAFTQESGSYYHHTLVSLIHQLSVAGWDCHAGFFQKRPQDLWINVVVYKSQHKPMDPRNVNWHDLSALKLLPESAENSVFKRGYLDQRDLVLPWIDQSISSLAQQ